MRMKPYEERDGKRVWLSRDDIDALLSVYCDEQPRRHLALQLGLHGLRSQECDKSTTSIGSAGHYIGGSR